MNNRVSDVIRNVCKKTVLIASLTASIYVQCGDSRNLIKNPGFEKISENGNPENWTLSHRFVSVYKGGITHNIVHSGKNAARIIVTEYTPPTNGKYGHVGFFSDLMPAPSGGTLLKFTAWAKGERILSNGSFFKFRVTCYFFDITAKQKISHKDIACIAGSFEWKEFKGIIKVPEKAVWMKVAFSLTACTGVVWVDDLSLTITGEASEKKGIRTMSDVFVKSVIIPRPWKSIFPSGLSYFPLEKIYLEVKSENNPCINIVDKNLKDLNIGVCENDKHNNTVPKLKIYYNSPGIYQDLISKVFPDIKDTSVGKEGYFLQVSRKNIIIAADSKRGIFYAFQSLRQMLFVKDGRQFVYSGILVDKPSLARRGFVMGLQWFRQRNIAVPRAAKLKINIVWNAGSFLNGKFSRLWRSPFSESEKKVLKEYLKLCTDNFIEPYLSFGPRGIPPVHYSSEKEIDIIVNKIYELYKIGFRNFVISFDDLQNIEQDRLFYKDDIEKFKNRFGLAHAYFVNTIYRKASEKCGKITFGVLPFAYQSLSSMPDTRKQYLRDLSTISKDIKIWVVCLYSDEDIKESRLITGRKPFIWDNFYTTGKLPAFPTPLNRSRHLDNHNIEGYMFLPATPKFEDVSGISWLNAADYEWSPERYNPMQSFQNALAFVCRTEKAVSVLKEFSKFALAIHEYNFPVENKEKRVKYMRTVLSKLEEFKEQLHWLPDKLAMALNKDIDKYIRDIGRLLNDLKNRPYPIPIYGKKSCEGQSQYIIKDFLPLKFKKNFPIAQTEASISYDEQNLYFKIICYEPTPEKLLAKRVKRDSNVFQDDSVEIFIMPKKENSSGDAVYYHIVVNSIGTIYDAKHIHRRFNYLHERFLDWSSGIKPKISKKADRWEIEIALPFQNLGIIPKKGKRIYLNICRNRFAGGSTELSSYARLLKGRFHDPESFFPAEFK